MLMTEPHLTAGQIRARLALDGVHASTRTIRRDAETARRVISDFAGHAGPGRPGPVDAETVTPAGAVDEALRAAVRFLRSGAADGDLAVVCAAGHLTARLVTAHAGLARVGGPEPGGQLDLFASFVNLFDRVGPDPAGTDAVDPPGPQAGDEGGGG